MNPAKQLAHRIVTQGLDARLTNLETVVEAWDHALEKTVRATQASVSEERTARLRMAGEQRTYVDRGDKPADVFLDTLRTRSFWGRLRFLLLGT